MGKKENIPSALRRKGCLVCGKETIWTVTLVDPDLSLPRDVQKVSELHRCRVCGVVLRHDAK